MCLDQSPKLAVRKHWVSASTCAGSGVLPLAAFPLSRHAHPRAPPSLVLFLFSENLSSSSFTPTSGRATLSYLALLWWEVRPCAGQCLGATSVKQESSDGQLLPALVGCPKLQDG